MIEARRTGQTFLSKDEKHAELAPTELLEKGIETERLERIQIKDVVLETGIVDEDHIKELSQSLAGPRGQISPITVRARDAGESKIHFDVIDGFHRVEAMIRLGMDSAEAKVLYGCSDEELYDLRVLAASSVKSVQFVRLANWMRASFQQSGWSKRGLNLLQVFSLTLYDTPGRKLGLTPDEAASAKQWAKEKAKTWQTTIPSIWNNLRGIEGAAPDLVVKVRAGGKLTPGRFRGIVLPLEGDWDLQRVVAEAVMKYDLSEEDATKLAREVSSLRTEKTPEEIKRILSDSIQVFELIYPEEPEQPEKTAPQPEFDNFVEQERKPRWWKDISRLTSDEKMILDLVFGGKRVDLYRAAAAMRVSPDEFFNLFRRTIQKCINYFHDQQRRATRKRTKKS